jgi:hypothetical protein
MGIEVLVFAATTALFFIGFQIGHGIKALKAINETLREIKTKTN